MEGLLLGVVLVLVAGAFLGNLYASRRRRVPRLSVYAVIRRRLEGSADRERGAP